MARPSLDHEYGGLYGAGSEPVQGFLAGVRQSRFTNLPSGNAASRKRTGSRSPKVAAANNSSGDDFAYYLILADVVKLAGSLESFAHRRDDFWPECSRCYERTNWHGIFFHWRERPAGERLKADRGASNPRRL